MLTNRLMISREAGLLFNQNIKYMTETTSSVDIQKLLESMTYPAHKQQIINYAKEKDLDSDIISALNGIPNREYMNSTDVESQM